MRPKAANQITALEFFDKTRLGAAAEWIDKVNPWPRSPGHVGGRAEVCPRLQ